MPKRSNLLILIYSIKYGNITFWSILLTKRTDHICWLLYKFSLNFIPFCFEWRFSGFWRLSVSLEALHLKRGINDWIIIDGDGRPTFILDFVLPWFRPRSSQTPGPPGSHDPLGSPENAHKCLIKCGENNWGVNINLVERSTTVKLHLHNHSFSQKRRILR